MWREPEKLQLNITIPAGMVATVEVPSDAEDSPIAVRSLGARYMYDEGRDLAGGVAQEWEAFAVSDLIGGVRRIRLGSGRYSIESTA